MSRPRYALRAGDRARSLLAYEDAMQHYEHALQVLDVEDPTDERRCADLLLALGEAQHDANARTEAKATFQRLAGLARRLSDPELLARAALGYGRSWLVGIDLGISDGSLIDLLEEALGFLPGRDSELRARLLGNLAMATYWSPRRERSAELSRDAVEVARRVGDPATLAAALASMHWGLWPADRIDVQLATAREIVHLSEHVADAEMALQGRVWAIATLLNLGDVATARCEIDTYARRAEELKQPRYLASAIAMRANLKLLAGEFLEAESLIERGTTAMGDSGDQALAQAFGMQTFLLLRHRGRLDELEDGFTCCVAPNPAVPGWRCALANLYAQLGRGAEARIHFEHVAANDFRDLPRDITWLPVVALLSEVCSFLRDAPRASTLYDLLRPYTRHFVTLSGIACFGAAARFSGLLAATLSRWNEADQHFREAATMNASIEATPWLAQGWYDHAEMLLGQNDRATIETALTLVERAQQAASDLGMRSLQGRTQALLSHAREAAPEAARRAGEPAPTATPSSEGVFRREGEYWTMRYAGSLTRLKETKGFCYIAALLRQPGEAIRSVDLPATIAPRDQAADDGDTAMTGGDGQLALLGSSDAGAPLDAQAKSQYRRRLRELREDLEEATRCNDTLRAARIRYESEVLGQQLSSAVAFGGRDRKFASLGERARVRVTLAIRTAIKKIHARHASLGEHLAARIKTGYECLYRPDPMNPVSWHV